jgi:23S rRNA (adenine2503-C2)-methyltransferase
METPILSNLTLADLTALLRDWGQPAFRARQIYRQLYVNFVADAAAMTDLPVALRERLATETQFGSLALTRVQTADNGLTRKALFTGPGGHVLETVLMVYPNRATVCVSTQAGCAMGCVFCATGKLGLLRNLHSGEIVEQVLWAQRELRAIQAQQGERLLPPSELDRWAAADHEAQQGRAGQVPARITNLVFMGMGEPFANYDRWWQAVERLHDPQGLNMGARSMTVSTVGLPQGIRRLAESGMQINLAISLHAPDDVLRSALMPINQRFPLADLLAATDAYIQRTNRRVSFEYVLLQGQNDHPHQALALAKLLKGKGAWQGEPLLCHVNLIPWNPVPGTPLGRSEQARVDAFQQILRDYGIACTVRVERGVAIAAACGQLAGQTTAAIPLV